MVAGAAIAMVAVLLTWSSSAAGTRNGLDEYLWVEGFSLYSVQSPGVVALVGGAIMLGLGITTLIVGRVLAISIIGIVSGALGLGGGLLLVALVAAFNDADGGSFGIGVILQPIAPLVSLVGSIVVTATRADSA